MEIQRAITDARSDAAAQDAVQSAYMRSLWRRFNVFLTVSLLLSVFRFDNTIMYLLSHNLYAKGEQLIVVSDVSGWIGRLALIGVLSYFDPKLAMKRNYIFIGLLGFVPLFALIGWFILWRMVSPKLRSIAAK